MLAVPPRPTYRWNSPCPFLTHNSYPAEDYASRWAFWTPSLLKQITSYSAAVFDLWLALPSAHPQGSRVENAYHSFWIMLRGVFEQLILLDPPTCRQEGLNTWSRCYRHPPIRETHHSFQRSLLIVHYSLQTITSSSLHVTRHFYRTWKIAIAVTDTFRILRKARSELEN